MIDRSNYEDILAILDEAFENIFGMSYASSLDDNSGCYIRTGAMGSGWMSPQTCTNIVAQVVDNLLCQFGDGVEFDHVDFNDWVREQEEEDEDADS